jgi:hypothetical protein
MKRDIDMSIILSQAWKLVIEILLHLRKWREMDGIKDKLVEWGGIEMT